MLLILVTCSLSVVTRVLMLSRLPGEEHDRQVGQLGSSSEFVRLNWTPVTINKSAEILNLTHIRVLQLNTGYLRFLMYLS